VTETSLPTIELISPPSGARVAQGEELEIESRGEDARGVDRIELWVDDNIYRVDDAGAQPTFHVIQRWRADAPGEHKIRVQAINVDARTSQPAVVLVEVTAQDLPPETPTPTLLPAATETSTPAPTATGAPSPTDTPAPSAPTPTIAETATLTPTSTSTPAPSGAAGMILIPGGKFLMGSNDDHVQQAVDWCGCGAQNFQDELYMHEVYVSAFYIDKHEVTNRQFAAFAQATGYLTDAERKPEAQTWRTAFTPGKEDHPVVWMSWNDANAYCTWAGKRLPTEAEWEKAARGNDARLWPWGSEWDSARVNMGEGGRQTTTAVGSFPKGASPYGAMDMAGNVWEWVYDWHSPFYYRDGADRSQDPRGPDGGQDRVLRGGGFSNGIQDVRTANRHKGGPAGYAPDHGFRCAK
jgi:formylglycine-generating enzyme required for sulfatase activity